MQSNVISKNLLQRFLQQKKLSGTVAFLNFISGNKNNLRVFFDFCNKHNKLLSRPLNGSVLFHGSGKVQKILKPNTSIGYGDKQEQHSYVYATDDPNYAIFLAILNLKNGSASVNATAKGTMLFVDLDFVNGPSKFKSGYVHVIERESFKKTKNREYKSDHSVNVLFTIPVGPADLTVPIYVLTE